MTEKQQKILREFLKDEEPMDSLCVLIDERIQSKINDIGSSAGTAVDKLYRHVEREGAIIALREVKAMILAIRDKPE